MHGVSVNVRRGRAEEVGAIMVLIARCVEAMQAGGSDQWDEHYPSREIIAADLAAGTLYVCEEEGEVAAIVVLDEKQAGQYAGIIWAEREGPQLVMHRLAVHPDRQGRGHARRLIAFAEACANEQGYAAIRLDTYERNVSALKLYTSLGYDRRGEIDYPGRTGCFPVFEKDL